MTPVLSFFKKKEKKKPHPIKYRESLPFQEVRFSVMMRPSFLYSRGLWFGDVLIVCLVLKFFPEVVDCFV